MKIVIVGGGTAGWLSSLFLANINRRDEKNPLYDITVVESEDIPIIGAGEGSTGAMALALINTLKDLEGLSEQTFFEECSTTFKLGIECKDWNGIGDSYFEPIQPTKTWELPIDVDFCISKKYKDASYGTFNRVLWDNNLSAFSKDGTVGDEGYAYHFDAHKVGEYFKKVALKNGIKLQKGTVSNTNINPQNGELQKVKLSDGTEIESDFWIDCTGFNRVLINSVGYEWVSYSDYLPVNSALVYTHEINENEIIKPSTLAWAMPNGWMWQIPTQERYGCGYCYSDKFVSEEQALKELQEVTGRKITPLRNIKFDSGRLKEVWKKNVLSVGLSSSFLEPLEATSIHSSIIQLVNFTQHKLSHIKENLLRESNIKSYNTDFNRMVDDFRDLVQIHYMVEREDTPFWKYIKNDLKRGDLVKKILELCEYRVPNSWDFHNYNGSAGWAVWSFILAGNKLISDKVLDNTMKSQGIHIMGPDTYQKLEEYWKKNSENYLHHTEFIQAIKNFNKNKSKNLELS
jgi:tryptophan 6-halogenase